MAVAVVASSIWFNSYLNSREFSLLLARLTGRAVNAEAQYAPFRWNGSSVFTESLVLEGSEGSAIRRAEVRQIRADVNWRAAWGGAWRIDELSVVQVEGEFGFPDGASDQDNFRPVAPSGLASLLPRRFELGHAEIKTANLTFGTASVKRLALDIRPEDAGWLIQGKGGQLILPFVPPLDIKSIRAREKRGQFFLTESLFRLGDVGKVNASGEFGEAGSLQVEWSGLKSGTFLPAMWADRLEGNLCGSANIRATSGSGRVEMKDGLIKGVPLLDLIGRFTEAPTFRRMPIQEMHADFIYLDGKVSISKCVVESKGLLRVEGAAQVGAGGELEGAFQVGVSPQALQWLPGSKDKVFTESRSGFLWTSMKVGGTIQSPTEDLSFRIAAAMGQAVIESLPSTIPETPDPGKAIDVFKGLINTINPLPR